LKSIAAFLLQRLGWAVVTLLILSVMVFFGAQVLPGNIGRAILGPLADAAAVNALNHELGVDRPLWTQYWDWISHFVRGAMGESFIYHTPVLPFIVNGLFQVVGARASRLRPRHSDISCRRRPCGAPGQPSD
jgi:peptide/nickel transport system permease protein